MFSTDFSNPHQLQNSRNSDQLFSSSCIRTWTDGQTDIHGEGDKAHSISVVDWREC
jgi:hypothetical protein